MTSDVIPRDTAIEGVRRVLGQILDRIARDRAAGRLPAGAEARIQLAERRYARRATSTDPTQTAA
ncbi:hypothetical protein SEA_CUMBERBATCH_34 [Streptomyces phage Cumberbatch]|uniref:Uncharacterized protein n=1 Tax=Streptomyces phage Cumberbatch TaxID=2736271 RepID=A0A6M9Z4P6_9CAUD|nr:hypothetical protein QEN65_gp34 [Streptomyces phage Cumberbatch]QKN87676.1 hypothetical protein SEA_CUMBERBATCH_34 [Streptomyces phage Cumberbatch]